MTDFLGELKKLCYQEHKHLGEARTLSLEIDVLVRIKNKGHRDKSEQMTVGLTENTEN